MVRSEITKAFLAIACIFQLGLMNMYAQAGDSYSRVGLTVQGGYTLPGNAVYSSNFNAETVASYNYGAGLKFAILPFWSVETAYRHNTIKGDAAEFETTMQSVSLKNMFNFNRLYQGSNLSEVLNVYALAGGGYDFYELSSADEQYTGREPSFMGGLGAELSVGKAFDIFSQYELKFSSNGIDNVNNNSRFVQIGIASAGIRINFGRDDARPLKHKPQFSGSYETGNSDFMHVTEEPQFNVDEDEAEDVNESEPVEDNLQVVETVKEEEHRVSANQFAGVQESQEQIDALADRLNLLQEKIDSLESKTEELASEKIQAPSRASADLVRTNMAPGTYVQVFTAREYKNAERVKNHFRSLLSGHLANPAEKVFVKQRDIYYEVMIGNLSTLDETSEIFKIAVGEFPDSFIFKTD